MEVKLVTPSDILDTVRLWLKFEVSSEQLPRHIFAAFEQGVLVAVAGLRMGEGPICFLDSMSTNPDLSSALRHTGIEMLVDAIFEKAKELQFKAIACSSSNQSMIKRALDRGFVPIPEITMVRSL